MPRKVKGPDGVTHTFPDDATDDEISAALERRQATAPNAPRQRTWTDTAVDALPAIGGALGGIVGGIGGTVGGLGVGGIPGGIGGAALGGAAGESARQLVNRARGVEAPATMGQAAQDIGVEGGIQGAAQAAGGLIGKGLTAGARSLAPALMQSALKPGIRSTLAATKGGNVPPVVRTLLNEGVNVTPGGIEKLNRIISASNVAIKDAIAGLDATVDPLKVSGRLTDTASRAANQVASEADERAVHAVGRQFLRKPQTSTMAQVGTRDVPSSILDEFGRPFTSAEPVIERVSKPMSIQAAQNLKTGTYAALKDKAYGEVKGPTIEASKALARGLKEEIAAEAQRAGIDLTAMNAREGAAITARDAIAHRVAMVGNRDPAGLAWLAHSPVTFIMALAERSPVVKSYLARGLWSAAAKSSGMPVEALKFAMGAIASKANQENE